MLAHADVASRYPVETKVKTACIPDFSIPKPLQDRGQAIVGATGARAARTALLTVLLF